MTAIWRLKASAERRFKSGHPWVYSNELSSSPKGIAPGDAIELHDASGKFLARGYGNPHSLIAFRALNRDSKEENPLSTEGFLLRLSRARELRHAIDWDHGSFRLCFGEADQVPGLIIDRYVLGDDSVVYVVQAHTAGIDRALPQITEALRQLFGDEFSMHRAKILVRRDLSSRKLEGLAEAPLQVPDSDLSRAKIRVRGVGDQELLFAVDLLQGQKTGFFLDQALNVELAARYFRGIRGSRGNALRILDLCCYVGQWSAKLANAYRQQGTKVHVTAWDASAQALAFARENIESQGAACETIEGDVLKDLANWDSEPFDLVIADPPALIQGRKDIPQGTHAYLQLNTQVFRLARPGAAVVSCSCSALLEEDQFLKTLSKAAYRNRAEVRWVGRGTQAPDHPTIAEFPEGRYLKAMFGVVSA